MEFGTVIKTTCGWFIFAKDYRNGKLACWDYDERHNLYDVDKDTIIEVTDEVITNVGRVLN